MTIRSFIYIILILSVLFSCRPEGRQDHELLLDKYLVEHSPRYISVDDGVVFRFKNIYALDRSDWAIQGAKITPHVEGNFQWSSHNTFRFIPSEPFDYGKEYVIELNLDKLLTGVDTEKDRLVWRFETRQLDFSVNILGLKIDRFNNSERTSVEGIVRTSDYVEAGEIEKVLHIENPFSDLIINWLHDPSGMEHRFSLVGIIRQEKTKDLTISWNGRSLGVGRKGSDSISIPSRKGFELTNLDMSNISDNEIQLIFTQPLDPQQNLEGMITIDQFTGEMRYQTDGNLLHIYLSTPIEGSFQLYVSDKVRSYDHIPLGQSSSLDLAFDMVKPSVRLLGNGIIAPATTSVIIPFEAINLNAVDLEVFKIHSDNILQFLQENDLNGHYYLDEVGKIVAQEKIDLRQLNRQFMSNQWMQYGLDISNYTRLDPGALYNIRIGFKKSYSQYSCPEMNSPDELVSTGTSADGFESIMRYYYDYANYSYENIEDPCYPEYYHADRFISQNILASNVGAIVKKEADNDYLFAISNLMTSSSLGNAQIRLFDFQQQELSASSTSSDGLARITLDEPASFAIIEHDEGFAYLKLGDHLSNSTSDFNVEGRKRNEGSDGFIYMDRGVYRPGDTVFLYFMLDDSRKVLPDLHPVSLTMYNPKGVNKFEQTTSSHMGKIYRFDIPGDQNALTGRWRAIVQVGSAEFLKPIRIETIKPNRLKITVENPDKIKYYDPVDRSIRFSSKWLHGTPASGLRTVIEANLENWDPNFEGHTSYAFSDPARFVPGDSFRLYDRELDANGQGRFQLKFDEPLQFPGQLIANLTTRVFENGGNYSEDYEMLRVSPYESYVGIKIPENRWGYKSLKIGEKGSLDLIALDDEGSPNGGRNLSVGVYNIDWRWWYYQGDRYQIYKLNSSDHKEAFHRSSVITDENGKARVEIDLRDAEYGRKLVRICDTVSGHCTGDYFYAEDWNTPPGDEERESLAKLSFSADQGSYLPGEDVHLTIPSESNSRLLISIESDEGVLFQDWVKGEAHQTEYAFRVNSSMSPNIYAHVTLLQPYDRTDNDLPVRMYGILPIEIKDPETDLNFVLKSPETLSPNTPFTLSIEESNQRQTAYTINIVDEGLLDLTSFVTPDPHAHFYGKRSLGVKTWDVYNQVLDGNFAGIQQIISTGGDGDTPKPRQAKNAIRFKPVVISSGPHYLRAGQSKNHQFTIPDYLGSVRIMVVGKEGNAYGSTEKTVPVRHPVMIYPTLPRVVSPGEIISIPINVFATEEGVNNVKVELTANSHLEILGGSEKNIRFETPGEKMVFFKAAVNDHLGISKILITAESGPHQYSQEIEMDVRNPNPVISDSYDAAIEPGEQWSIDYKAVGMPGTNEGFVEFSSIPPTNIERRTRDLIRYPYGCLEQTTSKAFPQLFLEDLVDLSGPMQNKTHDHVHSAIRRISGMQVNSGGFSYWPGQQEVDRWTTSYAGHFLLEARNYGYPVSRGVLTKWAQFQKDKSREFRPDRGADRDKLRREYTEQAYRLYVLALYGQPQLSAMNVLRQESMIPGLTKFLLAASYASSGKKEIALDLIRNTSTDVKSYKELSFTYGSDFRDMSLIAQTLMILDRKQEAGLLVKKIAEKLNSESWYNTQEVAQALLAIARYSSYYENDNLHFSFNHSSTLPLEVNTDKALYFYTFNPDSINNNKIAVRNLSSGVMFVKTTMTGQPSPQAALQSDATNRNITLVTTYRDLDGKKIDIRRLARGTDFIAEVVIKNQKSRGAVLNEMALSQIFPSGWEIQSGRLERTTNTFGDDSYDYRDIRDDRVNTFFDLNNVKKFTIYLTAAYEGQYILPPVYCEAMYDKEINAKSTGLQVEVIAPTGLQ